MAETRTTWLDENGALLVDANGAVYFTEECCCAKGDYCWQKYEAYCLDTSGNHIWGPEGTGKDKDAAIWSQPILVSSRCTKEFPTNVGPLAEWILDSPGTAHIWLPKPVEGGCNATNCAVPQEVELPDIPCSCDDLAWTAAIDQELPYYVYCVRMVNACAYSGDDIVAQRWVPIWDIEKFRQETGADRIVSQGAQTSGASAYICNYMQCNLGWPEGYCEDNGSYVALTSGVDYHDYDSCYTSEYGTWYVPTKTSPGPLEDEAYRQSPTPTAQPGSSYYLKVPYSSAREQGNYAYYPVCSAIGGALAGSVFHMVPGSQVFVPPAASTADFFVSNGHVWSMASSDGDYRAVDYALCSMYQSSAYAVWEPRNHVIGSRWTGSFADDEWGTIKVDVVRGQHTSLMCTRECQGAYIAKNRVPTSVGHVEDHANLAGNPMWYYRCFVTTDFPLDAYNFAHRDHAMGIGGNDDKALASVDAVALKCPVYWMLYLTQYWAFCPDDPPRHIPFDDEPDSECHPLWRKYDPEDKRDAGDDCDEYWQVSGDLTFCEPIRYRQRAAKSLVKYPYPWFADARSASAFTGWVHEEDEDLNQNDMHVPVPPMRAYQFLHDGHAYAVSRLNIDNFPSWRITDLCSEAITGNDWDVPKMDFSEDAYYCNECLLAGEPDSCYWPNKNIQLNPYSNTSDFPVSSCVYRDFVTVSRLAYHAGEGSHHGISEDCASNVKIVAMYSGANSYVDSTSGPGERTHYYMDTPPVYDLVGCPDYMWQGFYFYVEVAPLSSPVTSFYVASARCRSEADISTPYVPCSGDMTWQGNVEDPDKFGCGAGSRLPGYTFLDTWDHYNPNDSRPIRGLAIVQYALNCCEDGILKEIGDSSADLTSQISAVISCAVMGGSDCPQNQEES